MYEIFIFLIFVFPFSFKKMKERDVNMSLKLFHILFTLFLFVVSLSEFRTGLWLLYKKGSEAFLISRFPKESVNASIVMINILYFFLTFYLTAISVGLALCQEKARIRFLYSLPFIWLITVYYYYMYYIVSTSDKDFRILTLSIIGSIFLLIISGIYGIYSSKKMKRLFMKID